MDRNGDRREPAFSVLNNNGRAIYGESATDRGIFGQSNSSNGVYGFSGSSAGVLGFSSNSEGVYGWTSGANASGVYGDGTSTGYGVTGRALASGAGVRATSNTGTGLFADTTNGYMAVLAINNQAASQQSAPVGVYGRSAAGVALYGSGTTGAMGVGTIEGVRGISPTTGNGNGVFGVSYGNFGGDSGVRGEARGSGGNGVWGKADTGSTAFAIFGQSAQGYAGVFSGRVWVAGTLSKQAGGFMIDHPLDPANKYLHHSFVESPEMLNVYSGNVVTDANGNATVSLPAYFEALNRDFRYQLTIIGQPGQASVTSEIDRGRFSIRTDRPNTKVSWQVSGVRQDPYARSHPLVPEVDKPAGERGTYLSPQDHGQPETRGVFHGRTQAAEEQSRREPSLSQAEEQIRLLLERDRAIVDRPPPR